MDENRFGTPRWLLDELQHQFGAFDLDAAAEPWSAVCERYITKEQDLFKVKPIAKHVFGNWPYGKGLLPQFISFARESVLQGRWEQVTQLVPHYTAEGWWRHVEKPEGKVIKAQWLYGRISERLKNWVRLTSEHLVTDIIPVAKRLEHRFPPRYSGARESARFSSVVVRFVSREAA